jgi:hypothetical protein
MEKIKKIGLLNALGVLIYISLVAILIDNGEKIFGQVNDYVGPIAFLLLFTISAAAVGGLVLGQPIILYFEEKKKEAIQLFFAIMGWLVLFMAIALITATLL